MKKNLIIIIMVLIVLLLISSACSDKPSKVYLEREFRSEILSYKMNILNQCEQDEGCKFIVGDCGEKKLKCFLNAGADFTRLNYCEQQEKLCKIKHEIAYYNCFYSCVDIAIKYSDAKYGKKGSAKRERLFNEYCERERGERIQRINNHNRS